MMKLRIQKKALQWTAVEWDRRMRLQALSLLWVLSQLLRSMKIQAGSLSRLNKHEKKTEIYDRTG
jgi:hypothetical protein